MFKILFENFFLFIFCAADPSCGSERPFTVKIFVALCPKKTVKSEKAKLLNIRIEELFVEFHVCAADKPCGLKGPLKKGL